MDLLHEIFSGVNDLYSKPRDLAAIWLEKPLQTADGKKIRIAPDTLVTVKDGALIDSLEPPTHKIIGCYGTLVNQFELTLIRLADHEPLQIKL